ncbi:MAG: inositol monophosphatase family protein [Candidatus Omnitrophota bacterium]
MALELSQNLPSPLAGSAEACFALETVREAALLVEEVRFGIGGVSITKQDASPVTVGDFAAQALAGKRLREKYPDDRLVAEESSAPLRASGARETLEQVLTYTRKFAPEADAASLLQWIDHGTRKNSERFWVLDPIDGTKGFIRGDQYAVALALVEKGQVVLGAVACPRMNAPGREVADDGLLVLAVRGGGCWSGGLRSCRNFERVRVSDCADPRKMKLLRSVEAGHTHSGRTDLFLKALGVVPEPVLMDSQAKYALLASGAGDVLFYLLPAERPDYRMKIWDVAPGAVLVEEAGGRVSDLEGKALDFTTGSRLEKNPGILATNGPLHEPVLDALKKIL